MEFKHLGKTSAYPNQYNPNIIQLVPRRRPSNMPTIFFGFDLWRAYEISWLDENNKPCVAVLEIIIPADSKFIVESKSLKLYFNSFNLYNLESHLALKTIVKQDLESRLGCTIAVKILLPEQWHQEPEQNYDCIDNLKINPSFDKIDTSHLTTMDQVVEERLMSNLLKSNCLITNQPDWGSIYINYTGRQISHTGLLNYIVSYRNHNGFHEHCLDSCFADIISYCKPEKLSIFATYTRRGGIDISPFRSTHIETSDIKRSFRQ